MKNSFLLFLCFNMFFGMYTYAQPANNSCLGAQQLAIGSLGSCGNTLVTYNGTETDSGVIDPGCARYRGADLWYEFSMPASGAIRLETTSTGSLQILEWLFIQELTAITCH